MDRAGGVRGRGEMRLSCAHEDLSLNRQRSCKKPNISVGACNLVSGEILGDSEARKAILYNLGNCALVERSV